MVLNSRSCNRMSYPNVGHHFVMAAYDGFANFPSIVAAQVQGPYARIAFPNAGRSYKIDGGCRCDRADSDVIPEDPMCMNHTGCQIQP